MTRYFVCVSFKYLESLDLVHNGSERQTIPPDSPVLSDVQREGTYYLLLNGVTDEKQAKHAILQAVTQVLQVCLTLEAIQVSDDLNQKIRRLAHDVWVSNAPFIIGVYYPGINDRHQNMAVLRSLFYDGGNTAMFSEQRDILHRYKIYVNCRPEKPGDDEVEYSMIQAVDKYEQIKVYSRLSDNERVENLTQQLYKATIIGFCNSLLFELVRATKTLRQTHQPPDAGIPKPSVKLESNSSVSATAVNNNVELDPDVWHDLPDIAVASTATEPDRDETDIADVPETGDDGAEAKWLKEKAINIDWIKTDEGKQWCYDQYEIKHQSAQKVAAYYREITGFTTTKGTITNYAKDHQHKNGLPPLEKRSTGRKAVR